MVLKFLNTSAPVIRGTSKPPHEARLDERSRQVASRMEPKTSRQLEAGTRAGLALAAISAGSYGVITTLSRLSYEAGGTPWTVVLIRFLAGVVLFGGLILVRRGGFAVARDDLPRLLVVGAGYAAMTFGYLSAVAFIPVSLAALIFFTFPLMVAALSRRVGGRRLSRAEAGFYPLAFLGLALALGPSLGTLDWRGIALALFGAAGSAAIFLASGPAVARLGLMRSAFHSNLYGGAMIVLAYLILGQAALPTTALGWSGLAGATLFYLLAVAAQLLAIGWRGGAGAAIIFNLEPLVSIACASLLLGERLTLLESCGAGLVLVSILAATRLRKAAPEDAQNP
jgi:drug/metabolite transporter (DMT)-like permease